jgi:hypothetical protein
MVKPRGDNACSLPAEAKALFPKFNDAINAGRFSELDDLRGELFDIVDRWAGDNLVNDPDFQEETELEAQAIAGNWDQARKIHEGRVARATGPIERCQACGKLAGFLSLLEEWDQAAVFAAEAVEAARALEDMEMLVAMRLHTAGQIANIRRQHAVALSLWDEGLQLLREERMHDLIRAQLLIGRAESHLQLGNLTACAVDHGEAWEILQPQSIMAAAGVQRTVGGWWRVEAIWWEREGDWEMARDAWSHVVRQGRDVVQLAHAQQLFPLYQALIPLSRDLLQFAAALSRLELSAKAAEAIAEANKIRRSVHVPAFRERDPT